MAPNAADTMMLGSVASQVQEAEQEEEGLVEEELSDLDEATKQLILDSILADMREGKPAAR